MIQFPRCLLSSHSFILTILIIVGPVIKAQVNPNDFSYPQVN